MEESKFLETVTVDKFRAQKGVNKIEIKQNPHTGKCFPVYGCETGAADDKFINEEATNPVISQVRSPDTGDMFYMLYQRGEGGVVTLVTLWWASMLTSRRQVYQDLLPFSFMGCV